MTILSVCRHNMLPTPCVMLVVFVSMFLSHQSFFSLDVCVLSVHTSMVMHGENTQRDAMEANAPNMQKVEGYKTDFQILHVGQTLDEKTQSVDHHSHALDKSG